MHQRIGSTPRPKSGTLQSDDSLTWPSTTAVGSLISSGPTLPAVGSRPLPGRVDRLDVSVSVFAP
jgi:hypothetical protein